MNQVEGQPFAGHDVDSCGRIKVDILTQALRRGRATRRHQGCNPSEFPQTLASFVGFALVLRRDGPGEIVHTFRRQLVRALVRA